MPNPVISRRICWPDPDATCLEGGCLYCDDQPYRTLESISAWARKAGTVRHRGSHLPVDAWVAFTSGQENDFYAQARR